MLVVLFLAICVGPVDAALGGKWTKATETADWPARFYHEAVVFDGKMWVMGGSGTSKQYNDVWSSSDGVAWSLVTENAGWSKRAGFSALVFKNKLWVMGGQNVSTGYLNDVWSSPDGVVWTKVTDHAAWEARGFQSAVVYDNRIWVFGGKSDSKRFNDTWFSTDGIVWTAAGNAGWSPRYYAGSVVYDNRMWVIGGEKGGLSNDVWHSADGIAWIKATGAATWSPRYQSPAVVFDNKVWVLGGMTIGAVSLNNEVWNSSNGMLWTKVPPEGGIWSARAGHKAVVYNGRMWIMGGGSPAKRDVWYSDQSSPLPARIHLRPTDQETLVNGTLKSFSLTCDAPGGLSGIDYTMKLDTPANGRITGFVKPAWAETMSDSSWSVDTIRMKAVDLQGVTGDYNISLGTFSFLAMGPGTTHLTFEDTVVENIQGVRTTSGWLSPAITVTTDRNAFPRPQPVGGFFALPTDPDSDGRCEDLDGNTFIAFNDVLLMFTHLANVAAGNHGLVNYYDFDANGAIGYNDVVTLYNHNTVPPI